MSFKKKDQEAIAKLVTEMYNEGTWPSDSNGRFFDDALYTKIRALVVDMKGESVDDVKQQISKQLDVKLDNMYGSNLEVVFYKLYDIINNTSYIKDAEARIPGSTTNRRD